MATYTNNLNLKLPEYSEKADINDINENFKKIDDAINKTNAVTGITIGDQTYQPNEQGVVDLPKMGGGAEIDDSAPSTEKVFSSQKTQNELNQLSQQMAKDYLLKTGTAADASKLGGKEPKYYIQPRNLLDNSDFRNPVNQRRQTSYAGATYTIDRWFLSTDSVGGTVSIDDSGLTLDRNTINGYTFLQYIEKLDTSKVYTFAVKDVVGNVYLIHSVPNERNEETTPFGTIIAKTKTDVYLAFGVTLNDGTSITLEWAALYEGEYTAENLPPYVPKGYAAELAECLMYYYPYGSLKLLLTHNADGVDRGTFLFPTKMRIIPTLTYEITGDVDAQFTLEETTKQGFSCYANGVKGCVQIVNCIADADL